MAAEGLFTFINQLTIKKNRNVGDIHADLEQPDDLPLASFGQLTCHTVDRGTRGIRFNVHDGGRQPGVFGNSDPIFDFFLAGGGEHDLDIVR